MIVTRLLELDQLVLKNPKAMGEPVAIQDQDLAQEIIMEQGVIQDLEIKQVTLFVLMSYSEEKNTAGDIVMSQTSYFNPPTRSPYGRVSKNQQWVDTYNNRSDLIINGVQQPQRNVSVTATNKIIDINVPKTVEAGQFNTYIMSVEGESTKQVLWVDVETAVSVYQEIYLSGVLSGVGELVEIN